MVEDQLVTLCVSLEQFGRFRGFGYIGLASAWVVAEDTVRDTVGVGGFDVIGDYRAGREPAQRQAGSARVADDGSVRGCFVEPREKQLRGVENSMEFD